MLHVFPQIEAEYQKHDIGFSWVDLQWGITEQESRDGKTLELCLKEIERCQPFFLGLVGPYAGWVPSREECTFHSDRIDEFFRENEGRPITELEFLYNHSVAGSAEDSGILFLDAELSDGFDPAAREKFERSAEEEQRLHKLLGETYGEQALHDGIHTLEELGNTVKEMLLRRLKTITEADNAGPIHSSIRRNLNRQYYLRSFGFRREDALRDIALAAEAHEKPIIVIDGPPGSGKSTTLSFLYEELQRQNKNVLLRFLNDAVFDAFELWEGMIREIDDSYTPDNNRFPLEEEEFINLMQRLSALESSWIIMVDDADMYRIRNGARVDFLDLLLHRFPDNVTVILTSQPGAFDETRHTENTFFYHLPPLDPAGRKDALEQIERIIGKHFEPDIAGQIIMSEKCGDPQYLMWLVKYLQENAVYENLKDRTESALRNFSLEMLAYHAFMFNPKNNYGNVERMYMFLALLEDGLKEDELKKLLPKMSVPDFYSALGRLGTLIQYDEHSRVRLIDRTFRKLLLANSYLREYSRNYMVKRILSILPADHGRRTIAYVRMNRHDPGKIFPRMKSFRFCKELFEYPLLWREALEAAYRKEELRGIMESVVRREPRDTRAAFLFVDFLEDKGEYSTAIDLIEWAEAGLSGIIGPFRYEMCFVYQHLLILCAKNGDFDYAELILRHIGFIMKENSERGITPAGAAYIRSIAAALYEYSQISGRNFEDSISSLLEAAGRMNNILTKEIRLVREPAKPVNSIMNLDLLDRGHSVNFLLGQLMQMSDNSEAIETGRIQLSLDEVIYTKVHHSSERYQLHNRPGAIRYGGKIIPLDVWEYNTLMDMQRAFFLSADRMNYRSEYVVRTNRSDYFNIYRKLKDCYPNRMGMAFGFDGKQYLVYGFRKSVKLDEAAYLFWLLADGSKTVKDIAAHINGLFKSPDTFMIFKETGESIQQLYSCGLIWFDAAGRTVSENE